MRYARRRARAQGSLQSAAKGDVPASELAFGKTVTVVERDIDRYGRVVADVLLPDGRSLNRELVKAGLAWWYRKYAASDWLLKELEAEARTARRGLWSDPGLFRHGSGAGLSGR